MGSAATSSGPTSKESRARCNARTSTRGVTRLRFERPEPSTIVTAPGSSPSPARRSRTAALPFAQLPALPVRAAPRAFTRLSAMPLLLNFTNSRTTSARRRPSKTSSSEAPTGTGAAASSEPTWMPLASSCMRATAAA